MQKPLTLENDIETIYNGLVPLYYKRKTPPEASYLNTCEFKELRQSIRDIETLVDLGCGIGRVYSSMKGANRRYIGIDISANMLRAASYDNRGETEAMFIRATSTRLPLCPDLANYVVSYGLFEYVNDIVPHFKEVSRILKPDGRFIFTLHTVLGARRYNIAMDYTRSGWSKDQICASLAAANLTLVSLRPCIGPLRRLRSATALFLSSVHLRTILSKLIAQFDCYICEIFPHFANSYVCVAAHAAKSIFSPVES